MITKILKEYFWLIPFLLFFTTFFLCFLFFSQEKRAVPSLLYLDTTQGLSLLAHQQLNCRLLKEQESSWPAGTIIKQSPQPGTYIKPFQTIFITVAKEIIKTPVPCVVGLSRAQIKNILDPSYILEWHTVYSTEIQFQCIAQVNNNKKITLYESWNGYDKFIMPSFFKQNIKECCEFLNKYNIHPTVIHSHSLSQRHTCNNCYVTDQSPEPGVLISLSNPPLIQLKI